MRYLLVLVMLATVAVATEWVYWPDGEPSPVLGPVMERDRVYPPETSGETTGYTADNPAPDWYVVQRDEAPDGYRIGSQAWVKSNNLAVLAVATTVNLADEAAAQAAAAAANEAQAIAAREALVAAWASEGVGLQVKLLRRHLVALGFTPPWTFDTIKASLLQQVDANTLDATGKFNLLMALSLFNMLEEQMLSEDDIRDVRLYLEANGGT